MHNKPEQDTENCTPKVSVTTVVELDDEVELLAQEARATRVNIMDERVARLVVRNMILGPLDEVRDSSHEVVWFFQIA